MKTLKWIIVLLIVVFPLLILAQSSGSGAVKPPKPQRVQPQSQQSANEGGRVFIQNCSRCHNPPDGFSPRISESIVRHMRVRANLSEKDAKAVLRFFNP